MRVFVYIGVYIHIVCICVHIYANARISVYMKFEIVRLTSSLENFPRLAKCVCDI